MTGSWLPRNASKPKYSLKGVRRSTLPLEGELDLGTFAALFGVGFAEDIIFELSLFEN
jgi:hypothetical protein